MIKHSQLFVIICILINIDSSNFGATEATIISTAVISAVININVPINAERCAILLHLIINNIAITKSPVNTFYEIRMMQTNSAIMADSKICCSHLISGNSNVERKGHAGNKQKKKCKCTDYLG